ncbi:MAG: FliI/YscN family ATPase [Pseudobdellovibrionaceae bacterium]
MTELRLNLTKYQNSVEECFPYVVSGQVTEVRGLLIKGNLSHASLGSIVEIEIPHHSEKMEVEIIGFKGHEVIMMALKEVKGLSAGCRMKVVRQSATVSVSDEMLGSVFDGLGNYIDGSPPQFEERTEVPLYKNGKNPLDRRPIREALDTGIRAINSGLTVGLGQRVAIMAGSGVGKSVLLGMMARYSSSDVNVIAMIGERGREVREFIENDLGPEGIKKSVIVTVTSDQSPLLRMRGAFVATAIAEYFSKKGKNVLLMMDSVTRFAMAQREIGLSLGEPPSTRGYTPSVFATLPKLLERAGSFENEGSITGLYTTLVEADDMNDPIGDSVRSIVDGHIVLSRQLAQRGHFPSIDLLQSASRVMKHCIGQDHQRLATKLREALAIYKDAEDLINIGAYKQGNNPKIDKTIKIIDQLNDFLCQRVEDQATMNQTLRSLQQILIGF